MKHYSENHFSRTGVSLIKRIDLVYQHQDVWNWCRNSGHLQANDVDWPVWDAPRRTGWTSNLPEHIKVLAGVMLLVLFSCLLWYIFKLCLTYLNLDKIMKQMNKLVETISTHFSYEDDAPKRVKTVKNGTRSHEFYGHWEYKHSLLYLSTKSYIYG